VATGADVSRLYGPPDTVLEYTLYPPVADESAVQDRDTDGLTPLADIGIVNEEFEALLTMVAPPVTLPVPDAVNFMFKLALWPLVNTKPDETPLALTPGPEMLTFEIVTLPLPEFVTVTVSEEFAPTITFPRVTDAGLTVSVPVVGAAPFTVSSTLPVAVL